MLWLFGPTTIPLAAGDSFSETAGHIGRESGEPDFTFAVFDYVSDGVDVPYACRMQELKRLPQFEHVEKDRKSVV